MKICLGLQIAAVLLAAVAALPFDIQDVDDDNGSGGKHWALLVAGSSTWINYRHQADICHAYHIVRKNGIPDDRIIVMMYDDIAYNKENPIKGNVVNKPNGTNLYLGVPKDYTKDEVTPEVFLKVLTGDAEGVQKILGRPGKVLKSGPKDRVFVNFVDHGAAAVVGFPNGILHAEDLHKAITQMHTTKMYKELVIYLEACQSGSMFDTFAKEMANMSVYATASAMRGELAWSCYFDVIRQAFVGDCYSVHWMEDSDKGRLRSETLQKQFEVVKSITYRSHVQEFGDMTISKLPVGDFQGTLDSNSLDFVPREMNEPNLLTRSRMADSVSSRDVPLETLKRKIAMTTGTEQEKHIASLEKMYQRKAASEDFFKMVVSGVQTKASYEYLLEKPLYFTDYKCYKESVDLIIDLCPWMNLSQNDFALAKLQVLANLCEADVPAEKIWRAIGHAALHAEICVQ